MNAERFILVVAAFLFSLSCSDRSNSVKSRPGFISMEQVEAVEKAWPALKASYEECRRESVRSQGREYERDLDFCYFSFREKVIGLLGPSASVAARSCGEVFWLFERPHMGGKERCCYQLKYKDLVVFFSDVDDRTCVQVE